MLDFAILPRRLLAFSIIDRPSCSILDLFSSVRCPCGFASPPPSPSCCAFLLPSSACLQVWSGLSLVGTLLDIVYYVLVWPRVFLLFGAFAPT